MRSIRPRDAKHPSALHGGLLNRMPFTKFNPPLSQDPQHGACPAGTSSLAQRPRPANRQQATGDRQQANRHLAAFSCTSVLGERRR